MKTVGKPERFEGIQSLRLIAALLVVITHSTFYTHERLSESIKIWSLGAIGVDIFFIVSGFVMMVTVDGFLRTSDGWKYFVGRRVLRIVPMYWLATTGKLVTMFLLPAAVLHAELDPLKVILSYFFLPSTNIDGRFEPTLGVGWTLIFEMFFYAAFAVALFVKAPLLRFVGAVLAACCIASFFREPSWPAATMYFNPIVVYFFIGMVFARLVRKYSSRVLILASLLGLALVLTLVFMFDFKVVAEAESFTGIVLSSAVVLFFIAIEPWINGKSPAWILYMGEASYVLYLFHPLVAPAVPEVFSRIGIDLPLLSVACSIAVALLAAAIIHMTIERPVTKWLRPRIPYAGQIGLGNRPSQAYSPEAELSLNRTN